MNYYKVKNFFGNYWRGNINLVISFWIVFLVLGTLVDRLYEYIAMNLLLYPAVILSLLTLAWLTVGVWRSAKNYKVNNPEKLYGQLTKLFIIIYWLWKIVFPTILAIGISLKEKNVDYAELLDDITTLQKENSRNNDAKFDLALEYLLDDKRKNYDKAFEIFLELSESNDTESQMLLAGMYLRGEGTAKSPNDAVYWLEKAANSNKVEAEPVLGLLFLGKEGVNKDIKKAVYWLERASSHGFNSANYILGQLYLEGQEVTEDYSRAKKWLNMWRENGSITDKLYYYLNLYFLL